MDINEPKYSVNEVAQRLTLDPTKIYILIKKKRLGATNVSTGDIKNHWRISEADVQSYLKNGRNR